MKKILFNLIAFLTIFVIVGCEDTDNQYYFKNTKEVYGFEAISTATILNYSEIQTTNLNLKPSKIKTLATEEITEEEIDNINKYISIMELMLADEEPITVIDEISDLEDYEKKMVIMAKDVYQNDYSYVLYYNETIIPDNDDNVDDDDLDDEVEIDSTLEGIMIVGENEYTVTGKREIEDDKMKVEFTSVLDSANWVKVEQEIEDGENKFEYTISDNNIISTTEIEIEKEDNETKLELSYEDSEIEKEYEFKIEEEDGQKVIKIEVEDNDDFVVKVYVIVDEETGETSYEYKLMNNKSYRKERRNNKDND